MSNGRKVVGGVPHAPSSGSGVLCRKLSAVICAIRFTKYLFRPFFVDTIDERTEELRIKAC